MGVTANSCHSSIQETDAPTSLELSEDNTYLLINVASHVCFSLIFLAHCELRKFTCGMWLQNG